MLSPPVRFGALAAATWLGFAPLAVVAQPPADGARVRQQVADQRMASDANEALATADRYARVDPAAAARVLRAAALTARQSIGVSPDRQAVVLARLDAKLAAIPGGALTPSSPAPARPGAPTAPPPAVLDAARLEAKEVRDTVKLVETLYAQDKFAEAQKQITALGKKYPNNPAVLALNGQGQVADRVALARESARDQEDRVSHSFRQVDESSRMARRDMELAKDHKQRMELRDRLNGVNLSPEEEAILKALETKVATGVTNAPFEEVLQGISDLIQKPILIDRQALADDNKDLKKPVTLPAGVSARTALRAVVQSQGMTFIIREKTIQVVTVEEARRTLVKRAYYLGDVLGGPLSGGATVGPVADYAQANQTALMIVDAIKRSVDPTIWEGQGGFATVTFHAPSLSIIVSAPSEVQFDIHRAMKRK